MLKNERLVHDRNGILIFFFFHSTTRIGIVTQKFVVILTDNERYFNARS